MKFLDLLEGSEDYNALIAKKEYRENMNYDDTIDLKKVSETIEDLSDYNIFIDELDDYSENFDDRENVVYVDIKDDKWNNCFPIGLANYNAKNHPEIIYEILLNYHSSMSLKQLLSMYNSLPDEYKLKLELDEEY